MTGTAGLLLLTGGSGRRLGGPKHRLPHPAGGTWGGHLVRVFEAVFPGGPVRVLGEPLPDRPGLPRVEDPRQGPAAALIAWAAQERAFPRRWWAVPCDQVRWDREALQAWHAAAEAADPEGGAWVVAEGEVHRQWLGGFLGGSLLPALAAREARSLHALAGTLPGVALAWPGPWWSDVDTPEALAAWMDAHPG
ncbi:MAG TPA: NTP transferase domain-containing protein [Holophaga sp.]|nr:NTP transferase domain-containing protein [Holophaga sp.]